MKPKREEKPAPYESAKAESKPESDNLGKYLDDFQKASAYVRNNYHSKWFDFWKAYNNRRTKIGYNSIADAFVPETRTIVESLVANIAGAQPTFEYIPVSEEQSRDTKVLSELMAYYWDANHMGTKSQSWVRDAILYGNGILHVTWDADRNIPCIDNVPLRDFFVDPTATSLEDARFAGFRFLADKEALKSEEVLDPETGELVKKYNNLDAVTPSASTGDSPELMDKANKESLMGGSTVGKDNERQIEVLLIYYMEKGKEKLVEIANRCAVIREIDTPYQQDEMEQEVEVIGTDGVPMTQTKTIEAISPFFPFALLRNTIDSSLFFATGDVEVIIDRQETLNDVENLDLDNLHYLNNVMWRIDPAYEDMASEIESTPGIVIPIPRYGLEPITKPQITSDLDAKKQEIKDEMRRATAADEIIQGSQASSRTTATEIAQVSNQAMTRFQTKVANLESEGFAQLGSVLFKMAQIFVDQETVVRIVGPEGVAFKDFDPYEFNGYYEPHVKLDSTVKRIKEERGMKDNQFYQLLMNNPVVNQQEAIRLIGSKQFEASDEELNRLLTLPPAPEEPDPNNGVNPDIESEQAIAAAREDFEAQQGASPEDEEAMAIQMAQEDFAREQELNQ